MLTENRKFYSYETGINALFAPSIAGIYVL